MQQTPADSGDPAGVAPTGFTRPDLHPVCAALGLTDSLRLAQGDAQQSERQKQAVLNSLPNILIEQIDTDMRVVWANDAMAREYGLPLNQVIGRVCHQVLAQQDAPCPGCLTVQALRAGHSIHGEFTGYSGRVYLCHAKPLRNETGHLVGAINVAIDITQRKQSEQKLSDMQQRFRRIVDSNMIGIVVSDARGSVLEANDYFLQLIGGTPEELAAGRIRWIDITPPEHLALDFQAVAEARQKGVCTPYEKEYRLRNGSRIPVLIGLAALPGVREQFAGFVLDLTARKQAEQALRDSEERFRGWFNQAAVGAALLDPNGRFVTVNQRLCDMLGYSREELLSRTFRDITHPEDHDLDKTRFCQLMAGQIQTYTTQKRNVHRDGHIVWVNVAKAALRNSTGRITGCIAVAEDITGRKQAEEALRASEEQLLHAQKMEAIGLLAGGIAHDFRNQLTVIKGYSEMLLRRGMLRGAAREHVEEILKAANRSASLTGELLAFSRKEILRPEVVDLNNVVQEIAKTIRSMLGEDVCLSIVPGLDLHSVRIDPGQFQQALVNLAMNARDAMPQGGQLTVETANVEPDSTFRQQHPDAAGGPHVVVTVRDSGEGMDKNTLARIFEPFFTTKPQGRGTGLGLSMVYGFVRQSGGHVDAISRPGQGATFRLYFPCEARTSQAAPARTESLGLVHGTGTILLTEDDQAIRRLTAHTLQECGYAVLEAADAQQALRLVEAHPGPIDLLVTDVVMPGMNGYELACKLRNTHPDLKVLYVSGYTGDALEQRGVLEQRANLLVKPFNTQQIASAVRKILGKANPT